MRVVVADLEVLRSEIVDVVHFAQDPQLGEGADLPLELRFTQMRPREFEIQHQYVKKTVLNDPTCTLRGSMWLM